MEEKPNVKLTSKQIGELRMAIAEDLELLGYLQAKELDREGLDTLRSLPFADHLGIVLTSKRALEALQVLDSGLAGEGAQKTAGLDEFVEELACDYAGIYLTHQCGVSPCESPWLDEDHLERQQPMFDVRDWYQHHGMKAKDWRKRPDDHLATQLVFVAHLMRNPQVPLTEVGHFLDEHLLKWIGAFAQKVAPRCATPFYAGLVMLTSSYLEELRDMVEALTGLARPEPEEEKEQPDLERLEEGFDITMPPDANGPGW